MKDQRYQIRIPDLESKIINDLSTKLSVDKSLIIRFCISSALKIAQLKKIPENFISPELAFIREALQKK